MYESMGYKKKKGNCSAGRRISCADRKKVIQECKNPIAESDFGWIFAINVKVLNVTKREWKGKRPKVM
nr:hypothetical protein [uncultured Eisenbergiella sp.]